MLGTYTAATTPLWSKEKAFFVDSESVQVVVWNPSSMELIQTIPLEAPPEGELVAKWTSGIAVTPDRVYVSTFWATGDGAWTTFGDHARLFAIDPETLEVVETTDDDRCQTLGPSGVASDGTAYFSPWDYHTAVHSIFGEGFGSTSCALRIRPGENALDAEYSVDLSELVGGLPAGGMVLVDDETALLHVWDNSLQEATPEDWEDKRWEPGYYWYRWEIGSDEAERLPDQEPSTEGSSFIRVDGKFASLEPNTEYTETTVRELRPDGTFKSGLKIPGWATTMLRAY